MDLSDTSISNFITTHSIIIGWLKFEIPIFIGFVLKLIAILNPNVPTDKIRDLLTWKIKAKE